LRPVLVPTRLSSDSADCCNVGYGSLIAAIEHQESSKVGTFRIYLSGFDKCDIESR